MNETIDKLIEQRKVLVESLIKEHFDTDEKWLVECKNQIEVVDNLILKAIEAFSKTPTIFTPQKSGDPFPWYTPIELSPDGTDKFTITCGQSSENIPHDDRPDFEPMSKRVDMEPLL